MSNFRFRFDCTHKHWINKPDPLGLGHFTYDTNDKEEALERFAREGVRVNFVVELRREGPTKSFPVRLLFENAIGKSK